MGWMGLAGGVLFGLTGLAAVVLTAVGLPGTWLVPGLGLVMLGASRAWPALACATPDAALVALGGGLALVGEILETIAGAAGTRAGGGSRRGMVGAIVGGIVGGLLFTGLVPVPILGTLAGTMLGTFVGAFAAEATAPASPGLERGLRAAAWATLGRLAGTFGKTLVALILGGVFTVGALGACRVAG